MASYVEVSDEGAARAAAGKVSALGDRLEVGGEPPEPLWGNDELGIAMRAQYDKEAPVDEMLKQRKDLAERLRKLGDNVRSALAELDAQEQATTATFTVIHVPRN